MGPGPRLLTPDKTSSPDDPRLRAPGSRTERLVNRGSTSYPDEPGHQHSSEETPEAPAGILVRLDDDGNTIDMKIDLKSFLKGSDTEE